MRSPALVRYLTDLMVVISFANAVPLESNLPATRKVIRQVSFGRYNLSLEPLATNCEKEKINTFTEQFSNVYPKLSYDCFGFALLRFVIN